MIEYEGLIIDEDTAKILAELAGSQEDPRILAEIAGMDQEEYINFLEDTGLTGDPHASEFLESIQWGERRDFDVTVSADKTPRKDTESFEQTGRAFEQRLVSIAERDSERIVPVFRVYREVVQQLLNLVENVSKLNTAEEVNDYRSQLLAMLSRLSRELTSVQLSTSTIGPEGSLFLTDLEGWFSGSVLTTALQNIANKLGIKDFSLSRTSEFPPMIGFNISINFSLEATDEC